MKACICWISAPTRVSVVTGAEKLTPRTVFALTCALAGCFLVVGGHRLEMSGMDSVGVISGILAGVSFAWYSLQGEYGARKYPSWTVLFYAMAFAALPWNIFMAPLSGFARGYSPMEWAIILYISLIGTALPFGLYLKGAAMIRSTRASITATLEPIIAGIVSFMFLGEVMGPAQVAGGALVILSIVVMQLKGLPLGRSARKAASGSRR